MYCRKRTTPPRCSAPVFVHLSRSWWNQLSSWLYLIRTNDSPADNSTAARFRPPFYSPGIPFDSLNNWKKNSPRFRFIGPRVWKFLVFGGLYPSCYCYNRSHQNVTTTLLPQNQYRMQEYCGKNYMLTGRLKGVYRRLWLVETNITDACKPVVRGINVDWLKNYPFTQTPVFFMGR